MSTSTERRRERRHGKVKQQLWIPALGRSVPPTHIEIRSDAIIIYDRPTSDPRRTRIFSVKPCGTAK
jgi:hypothetical protein